MRWPSSRRALDSWPQQVTVTTPLTMPEWEGRGAMGIWTPWSAAFTDDCLKPMLPATMVPVSTERIMPMPARVIATSTIRAMNSVTPRCLRARAAEYEVAR